MRKIQIENITRVKKSIPLIENKIKISLLFDKNTITIKGSELDEYLTDKIISAIDFGFSTDDSLLLTNQNFVLELINIKEHTPRKNLKDIRARLIGKNGKAKKTIEKLTGAVIIIKNNDIGIIVDSNHLDSVIQAIESLIRGSKHGNVFSYLEKQNTLNKKYDDEDLGLKTALTL